MTVHKVELIVDSNGTRFHSYNGKLHRDNGPAVESADGKYTRWYRHGKLHREDGPAVEDPNGHKEWFVNGKRHREGGPAVERPDGVKHHWLNDVRQLVNHGVQQWYS
jgi:hypothetical protein